MSRQGRHISRNIFTNIEQSRQGRNNREMANTYIQLYIQFIFSIQNRALIVLPTWKGELHKYKTGIAQNNKHKFIAVI